jgi:hypothetical protein
VSYRDALPQLTGKQVITDGGMETTLIFHHGLALPLFASFDLLKDDVGTDALRSYFEPYVAVAREHGVGIALDTPITDTSRRSARAVACERAEEVPASRRRPPGGAL